MKRIISVTAVLLAVLMIFAGCSVNRGGGIPETQTERKTVAEFTVPARPKYTQEQLDKMVAFMSLYGLRPERVEELREQMARVDIRSIDKCESFETLHAGDCFPVEGGALHAVYAPGHSEGQCMFYLPERKLLFSADMLLPQTFAPVGLRSYGSRDPVAVIVEALDRLAEEYTDPEIHCLPGHGWALEDVGDRMTGAADHFRETAQWYLERCRREAANAYTIAEEIASGGTKRKFHLIMSEAMAYLEYLHRRGQLIRETDEAGAYRFAVR